MPVILVSRKWKQKARVILQQEALQVKDKETQREKMAELMEGKAGLQETLRQKVPRLGDKLYIVMDGGGK